MRYINIICLPPTRRTLNLEKLLKSICCGSTCHVSRSENQTINTNGCGKMVKINRSLLPIKAHYFFFMAGTCSHTILNVYDSNDWLVAVIVCRASVSAESDPHKCATAHFQASISLEPHVRADKQTTLILIVVHLLINIRDYGWVRDTKKIRS